MIIVGIVPCRALMEKLSTSVRVIPSVLTSDINILLKLRNLIFIIFLTAALLSQFLFGD